MRYIIIFSVTIILSLFIIFYNPYLGVYKDSVTINLNNDLDNYSWNYTIDNDNLKLVSSDDSNWKFIPQRDGETNLLFSYSNNDDIKYEIYYKFKIKNKTIYWLEGYCNGLLSYPNPY